MSPTTVRDVKVGTVGAYLTSGDIEVVRQLRRRVGRVTLSGKSGLRTLVALAKEGDTEELDLDPATYLEKEPENALFPFDWVARQRELGLDVVRSAGMFARRNDPDSLAAAFAEPISAGVVRVVSLSEFWLRRQNVATVIAAVRNCDEPIALVLAALFDPLETAESVESLRELIEAASVGERRLELLRTDTHGIPFAAHGGALSSIGLTSSGRHHPQPMNRKILAEFERRQQSTSVWVPDLLGWQQGAKLDSLRPFGGAGLTDCGCDSCDGKSLLRFATEWPQVPKAVRAEAQSHDVASWVAVRNRVMSANDPGTAWARVIADAQHAETTLVEQYKVSALKVPQSLREWI